MTSSANNPGRNGREGGVAKGLTGEEREKDMALRRQDQGPAAKGGGTSPTLWRLVEIFVAEVVANGMMLFFGCMSQLQWKEDAPLPPWQGSLVFALVVTTLVQSFGHISSAHLNPAVTLCLLVLGNITPLTSVVYLAAETIGALIGFGLLKLITPCDIWDLSLKHVSTNLCSNIPNPSVTDLQAIAVEFLATACLILVVCSLCDARTAHQGSTTSLKFGATVLALCITAGPFTGCSMNPTRSFAPAFWNGAWQQHWIYWLAPLTSAFVTTVFYQTMFMRTASQPELTEDLPLTGVQIKTQTEETKEGK